MPRRTTRLLAAASASLTLALALAGCGQFTVPVQGDAYPPAPTRSLDELLGVDRGEDGELLDAASGAILEQLLEQVAEVNTAASADLADAVADEPGQPSASGTTSGALVVAASFAATTGTAGVDVPVITNRSTTKTGTQNGRDYTTTTTDTNTISGQREVTVHDATTTVGTPETGNGSSQHIVATQEKDPCAADGEPAGTWKIEQTQTVNRPDGLLVTVSITTSGTVVRTGDGTVSLRDVTVTTEGSGIGADGSTTSGNGFTVNAEINNWDTHGDITDARGTFTVAKSDGMSDADAIALAGMQLDAFQGLASDVADRGEDLRNEQGLCVRIVVDTHGVTTLADGEKATFDARVIDPGTGDEIADAKITVQTADGDVSPGSATGHGTFKFTASGDPVYRVSLSTETPRGGHNLGLTYGAQGWSFEGVSYSYVTATHDIAVTITWNGKVCGEVWDEWQLDWQMVSAYGSPLASGTQRPVELDDVTRGDRAILVYQEIPNPADGEPPFRLWIDDENAAKLPNQQRVEVHPEPLAETCVSG